LLLLLIVLVDTSDANVWNTFGLSGRGRWRLLVRLYGPKLDLSLSHSAALTAALFCPPIVLHFRYVILGWLRRWAPAFMQGFCRLLKLVGHKLAHMPNRPGHLGRCRLLKQLSLHAT